MQTRRDQLQAFRFQNRRALAALVTGEPNVVEPPMRRLTVMTIAGVMIAILVAVVFALLGKFRPDAGDSWKDAGAIILDDTTGATYLYAPRDNTLHPVVNYTSAVLALPSNASPHIVHVDPGDIKSARIGGPVGIPGLPISLPKASSLVSGPWAACSDQSVDETSNAVTVRTSVHVNSTAGSRALATASPLLVQGVQGGDQYVLVDHERLAVSADVAAKLGLSSAVPVSTAFLDGVPAGPALRAPSVPDAGATSPLLSGARVGQVVQETSSKAYAVVLRDGFQLLQTDVQRKVMETLRVGSGNGVLLPAVQAPDNVVGTSPSRGDGAALMAALGNLPARVDAPDPAAQRVSGVCAVYRSTQPSFGVRGSAPSGSTGSPTETSASARGRADSIDVPSDGAALVRSDDGAKTVFVVDSSGKRFALAKDAQSRIGYGDSKPTTLARQLLALVPDGPAMDPDTADRPASS